MCWSGVPLLTTFENSERCRIMIEQDQGAADGTARQHIAGFVFLEGARPATDQVPRLFLGQAAASYGFGEFPEARADLRSEP